MHKDEVTSFLQNYKTETNPILEEYLDNKLREACEISKIPAEIIDRFGDMAKKGKHVRGALMKLGYEICGGTETEKINKASLSLELFQSGLLVHDDIMDQDDVRRGAPSIHKQFSNIGEVMEVNTTALHFGEAIAICTGDLAFYLSWDLLANAGFDDSKFAQVARIYIPYAMNVCYGQSLDVTNSNLLNISEKDILKVFELKTAEYTGVLPLLMGATFADPSPEQLASMKKYGLALGWAFQIQDDILGMFGNEKTLGKPIGSDIKEGKNTLLILHAMQNGSSEDKAFLKGVLGNQEIAKQDITKTQDILKSLGSYDYVVDKGWEYVNTGIREIPTITDNTHHKKTLESIIRFMMERAM